MNDLDYIECKLCGVRKRQLFKHLQAVHSMTFSEYRDLFPGAPNLCPSVRKKISEAKFKSNPMSNPDNVEKIRQTRRKNKPQWLAAINRGFLTRKLSENSFHHVRGGIRKDLGQYFRSTWEANLARILGLENVPYQYEKVRVLFEYGNGNLINWVPDFYLPEQALFVEVKGTQAGKWDLIQSLLSKTPIRYVTLYLKEMVFLRNMFSFSLPNWESTSNLRRKKHCDPYGREAIRTSGYMLEKPSILEYFRYLLSERDNLRDAVNQQGSRPNGLDPSETERQTLESFKVMIQSDLRSDTVRPAEMTGPIPKGISNKNGVFFEAVGVAQLIGVGSSEAQVTGNYHAIYPQS